MSEPAPAGSPDLPRPVSEKAARLVRRLRHCTEVRRVRMRNVLRGQVPTVQFAGVDYSSHSIEAPSSAAWEEYIDDEYVDPRCLAEMFRVMGETGADAVIGSVEAKLPRQAPRCASGDGMGASGPGAPADSEDSDVPRPEGPSVPPSVPASVPATPPASLGAVDRPGSAMGSTDVDADGSPAAMSSSSVAQNSGPGAPYHLAVVTASIDIVGLRGQAYSQS